MRTTFRIILVLLAIAALSLAGGWTYQRIAERLDNERYRPPGSLHLVDGRPMHIHCQGSGSPTILIEQGIGGPSIDWNQINEQMARITRVCDYDRAGMGYSAPSYKPTRADEVVKQLHALLAVAGIDDELVIVGWSAGGLYAREYYRQFPDKITGMVLVDSAHEQAYQRMPPQPSNQENLNRLMRKYHQAQFGWLRMTGEIEEQFADSPLSGPDRERLVAIFEKAHTYRTLFDEGVGLEQDLAAGVTPPGLGDIPLVVIAEGKPRHPYMVENLKLWHQLQQEVADLSTRGRLVIAAESAHFIHRTEPELILNAVHGVVEAARATTRANVPNP
jgi:pimeloyl-ACP methyl ester carboxylesterase